MNRDHISARDVIPRDALLGVARQAFGLGEALDWKSYDPYDILLSPLAGLVRERSPLGARIFLQIGKRSGSLLRRFLRVPPHEEPEALAACLQAAALLARGGEGWAAVYIHELSQRLRRRSVSVSTGNGWGLEFPWVSRFGGIGAREPNIYTTTVACRALLEEYELERHSASLDAAVGGVQFILGGLGAFSHGGRAWLRYTASSTNPIVNVQASSASLFARIVEHWGDDRLLAAADRAADAVVASQRADGSWPYSDDGCGGFVDGFHSGFTLQGLQEYAARRRKHAVPGTGAAIAHGFTYFKEHLLTPDGLPRGFADGRVSLDGQNLAQSIQTLVVCGSKADVLTASRNWQLAIQRCQLDEADFPLLRWRIGPALLATAFLVQALDLAGSADEGPPPAG